MEEEIFRVGDQLLSPSKNVSLRSLEKVTRQLQMMVQPPSQLTLAARVPVVTNSGEYKLLWHKDGKVTLLVARCLNEILRVTTPDIPYEENIMQEFRELQNSLEEMQLESDVV